MLSRGRVCNGQRRRKEREDAVVVVVVAEDDEQVERAELISKLVAGRSVGLTAASEVLAGNRLV